MIARRRTSRSASPGFTLIELMMVIVIISILIALSIPLIGDLVTQSRRSATKTTIIKLNEILQKRLDAFERGFPNYFLRQNGIEYQPANPDHVKFRKTTFTQMFLTNIENELTAAGNTKSSQADSAEVLYHLVTQRQFFGTAPEDAGQFNAAEIGDTDGDGRKEFVDSWGQPIVFYLYPTRLIKPDGTNIDRAKARYLFRSLLPNDRLNEDPDDPFGVLFTLIDVNNNNMIDNAEQTLLQNFEKLWHTFGTYHTPLIVSAGPDGALGLYEPYEDPLLGRLAAPKGNVEDLYDDISNHNIKAGDK
jgi:prepilin-type N-terminal cleavage/methylation domain-containing protein